MSVLLGLAAFLLIAMLPLFERPGAIRTRALRSEVITSSDSSPLRSSGTRVWRGIQRIVPPLRPVELPTSIVDKVVPALALVVVTFWLYRPAALVVLFMLIAAPVVVGRAQKARRIVLIERQLPMVVDLFRIAIAAGMNVPMAVSAIAERVDGPLGEELAVTSQRIARGQRTGDALEALVDRTALAVRSLSAALASAERYGAPLSSVLERLAIESRADQERRAEKVAKQLSTQLLFPVAGFTLPAFVLLTVAPLLAGAYSGVASSFF